MVGGGAAAAAAAAAITTAISEHLSRKDSCDSMQLHQETTLAWQLQNNARLVGSPLLSIVACSATICLPMFGACFFDS